MRSSTELAYVTESDTNGGDADLAARARFRDRAKRATTMQVSNVYTPEQLRTLGMGNLLLGRYMPKAEMFWETNASGSRVWMMGGTHRIYEVVMAQLKANQDLVTRRIAEIAKVSQGYVSRQLKWLVRFGFITILGVFRGRWGRVIAKLRSMITPVSRAVSSNGVIIHRPMVVPTFDDAFYRAWDRNSGLIE